MVKKKKVEEIEQVDIGAERAFGSAMTFFGIAIVLVITIVSLVSMDLNNKGEIVCEKLGFNEFKSSSFQCEKETVEIVNNREYVKTEMLQLSYSNDLK